MKKLIIATVLFAAACDPMPREAEVSIKFTSCMNEGLNALSEAGRPITPEVWEVERQFCLAAAEASTK